MQARSIRCLGLSVVALVGCQSAPDTASNACAAETRAETGPLDDVRLGRDHALTFEIVDAQPAVPARGDNVWRVRIASANPTGSIDEPPTLTVVPFMPDHGHGSSLPAVVTPTAQAGELEVSPVNIWMPGYWETTMTASLGGQTDSVMVKLCIPN